MTPQEKNSTPPATLLPEL